MTPEEREGLLRFLYSKLADGGRRVDTFSTAPQYAVVALKYASGPAIPTHFTSREAVEMFRGRTRSLTEFIGGCGAGRLYCGVEPNGDIVPCVFMPIKLGNIREKSFTEIWKGSSLLEQLRNRDLYRGCEECEFRYVCGGCRARAYSTSRGRGERERPSAGYAPVGRDPGA